MEQRHRIRKFIIEAEVDDLQRSHAQRDWIRRLTMEVVMPRLEKRLSELASGNEVTRLSKLELDLGFVQPEMQEEEIVRRIDEAISKISLVTAAGVPLAAESRSLESHRTEAMMHYLLHGVLPWWAGKAGKNFQQQFSAFLASHAVFIWQQLQRRPQAETALLRLMRQLTSPEREAFIRRAVPQAEIWLEMMQVIAAIERATNASRIRLDELKVQATAHLLSLVITQAQQHSPDQAAHLLAETLEHYFVQAKLNQVKWSAFALLGAGTREGSATAAEDELHTGHSIELQYQQEKLRPGHSLVLPHLQSESMKRAIQKKWQEWKPREAKKFKPLPEVAPEEMYLTNAGLVLLHPFLPALFTQAGFMQDDAWVSDEAAAQAAGYLQFIVTGSYDFAEPELALNKILCGLPPSHPLPATFEFTEMQRSEGEEVLRSLIENWPVLGNPEPDALRGSFLLREGRLTANGGNWQLKVNRQPFDMILDKLPFGLGVIHHPWMEGMVFVEW